MHLALYWARRDYMAAHGGHGGKNLPATAAEGNGDADEKQNNKKKPAAVGDSRQTAALALLV